MLQEHNYRGLLKFVLETILHILREKLALVKEAKHLAKSADDLVMVELCAVHSVVSYPDFIQIVQVINVSVRLATNLAMQNMDRVVEPKLTLTDNMVISRDDPQLMSKYMPQYRPGMNYNFSDSEGF